MGLFAPMKPAVDERGFSLIEAFCLLAFAVILLLITTQTGSRPSSRAKLIAVEIQMKNLNQALGDFRKDNGFYPTGSNGLQFFSSDSLQGQRIGKGLTSRAAFQKTPGDTITATSTWQAHGLGLSIRLVFAWAARRKQPDRELDKSNFESLKGLSTTSTSDRLPFRGSHFRRR